MELMRKAAEAFGDDERAVVNLDELRRLEGNLAEHLEKAKARAGSEWEPVQFELEPQASTARYTRTFDNGDSFGAIIFHLVSFKVFKATKQHFRTQYSRALNLPYNMLMGAALIIVNELAALLPEGESREAFKRKVLEDFAAAAAGALSGERPALPPTASEPAEPRGPRVKPNPALPDKAPELYHDRQGREELGGKKENVIQFIERVYAPWQEILTRADLRRLDRLADRAVENWITAGKRLPEGLLLTEYELNTAKRELEAKRKPQQRFARMLRGEAPAV
jgi:hypothetical protein